MEVYRLCRVNILLNMLQRKISKEKLCIFLLGKRCYSSLRFLILKFQEAGRWLAKFIYSCQLIKALYGVHFIILIKVITLESERL